MLCFYAMFLPIKILLQFKLAEHFSCLCHVICICRSDEAGCSAPSPDRDADLHLRVYPTEQTIEEGKYY